MRSEQRTAAFPGSAGVNTSSLEYIGAEFARLPAVASARLHGRLILTPPPCSPQTQQQGKDARAAAAIHLSHPRTQGTTPCTRCSTPPHSAVSSITRLARGVTLQGRGFAPRAMNRSGATAQASRQQVGWSFAGGVLDCLGRVTLEQQGSGGRITSALDLLLCNSNSPH